MGDAPWDPPSQDAIVARIKATDTDQLRTTATAFDTAAKHFYTVRGQINGLGNDLVNSWKGDGWKGFYDYSDKLKGDLGQVEATLHDMAGQLRAHAKVTDDAKVDVAAAEKVLNPPGNKSDKPSSTPNPSPSGEEPGNAWPAASNKLSNAVHAFHASEQRTRKNLWTQGSLAPGGIPLPQLPPPPKQSWWQSLLFGSPQGPQYWLPGKDGQAFGYDEDGNIVPAYMAHPMAQEIKEAGIPVGPILKWLIQGGKIAGEAGEGGEASAALEQSLAKSIQSSSKWSSGKITKHIGEWFNLPKGTAPTEAQRAQYLKLVSKAAASTDRVYTGQPLSGQQTVASLYHDADSGKWLLVQFYKNGEFATSFTPNPSQLNAILQRQFISEVK